MQLRKIIIWNLALILCTCQSFAELFVNGSPHPITFKITDFNNKMLFQFYLAPNTSEVLGLTHYKASGVAIEAEKVPLRCDSCGGPHDQEKPQQQLSGEVQECDQAEVRSIFCGNGCKSGKCTCVKPKSKAIRVAADLMHEENIFMVKNDTRSQQIVLTMVNYSK